MRSLVTSDSLQLEAPKPLPPRQLRALLMFERLTFPRGPTIEEMAHALGISNRGAHEHLRALTRKGFLKKGPFKARNLSLTAKGRKVLHG